MIQFIQQRMATFLFIGLISLMLVLMSHDVGNRGGTDVAGEIFFKAGAPAVRAGSSVTSWGTNLFKDYVELRGLRAENLRLTEAVHELERQRDQERELARSAERLQALLDLKQSVSPTVAVARVVGSGIASGQATLLIDRGSSDGVQVGMPVIGLGGVVGKVVLTETHLAKVQCLTDIGSGTAVALQDSGYRGILVGRTPDTCELIYVPAYAEVSHGDLLVTSGLDQVFPRGIPAG